jgi:hypothetical protein
MAERNDRLNGFTDLMPWKVSRIPSEGHSKEQSDPQWRETKVACHN